jgi:hypothetical protein
VFIIDKPFVKIRLHSGLGGPELGEKDLVLFYECDPSINNIVDSGIITYAKAILKWVNTCGRFQKGHSNEDFEYFKKNTFELVYLDDEQINQFRQAGLVISKDDLKNY